MYLCDMNGTCCQWQYWDKPEDVDEEDVCECGHLIEVESVNHSHWEWITEDRYQCHKCGNITRVDEYMGKPMYIYCPYCNAKMDGETK